MDPKETAAPTTDVPSATDQLSALIGAPIAAGTDANVDAEAAAAAAAAAAPAKPAEPSGTQPDPAKPGTEAQPVAKRKLTLGGKEVEVDEDAEGAFRREIDSRAGKWGSEKQRLENEIARLRAENETAKRGKPTAEDTADDTDDEDVKPPSDDLNDPTSEKYSPREWARQSRLYNEALVLHGMRAVETNRQQEAAAQVSQRQDAERREAVISRFYTDIAPELNDYREVVGAIYVKHKADLDVLARENPDDAMKALKRLAVARLAKIAEAGRIAEAPPTMGTSRRAVATSKVVPTADEEDESLGSLIRQGRMKRMQRAS
jgi:hypothetical protein